MRYINLFWQSIVIAFYKLAGVVVGVKKTYIKRTVTIYFTKTEVKAIPTQPRSSKLVSQCEELANRIERSLRIGDYFQCTVFVNHLLYEAHNDLMVIIEGMTDMTDKDWENVLTNLCTIQTYSESLLSVVDPTTIDADILKLLSKEINKVLCEYEIMLCDMQIAVNIANDLIKKNKQ